MSDVFCARCCHHVIVTDAASITAHRSTCEPVLPDHDWHNVTITIGANGESRTYVDGLPWWR